MNYYRKLLLLFSGIWFLVGIERFSIAYLLPEIADEFGMSQTTVGAAVAVFAISWGIGVFAIGNITDRKGRKKIAVVGGTLFAALFGWITGLVQGFLQLIAVRSLMGLGEGRTWAPVSSARAFVGAPEKAAYCASKGGVSNLTRQMAVDFGDDGITVNAVCPGPVKTDMIGGDEAEWAEFREHVLTPFVGEPDDVANVVAFLASDQARYITGHNLLVDGGAIVR